MATLGSRGDQRARLRRDVGHGADTALVGTELLDDCLDSAVREVNRHFPLLQLSSFDTVADQQSYTPLPSGGRRIVEVYYPVSCADIPAVVVDALASVMVTTPISEEGDRSVVEPAQVLGQLRTEGYLERFFTGQASIRGNTVYLIPVPGTSGSDVYFVYEANRYADVHLVDEIHERTYWAWARHKLHATLATGRGAITEVTTDKGITVKVDASKQHAAAAKDALQEFRDSLPAPRSRRTLHRRISP